MNQAGGLFKYSNTNYFALGLLVQTPRHKPFVQVMREEVFDPHGLKHTSLDRPTQNWASVRLRLHPR
ncbi:beta-lactamase family protein [Arthrobacter sp. DNA4]|uniref:serine hydrolase n=1 Tax=Arthrobacter sp. DNA4 TaxID=2963432 RepID=UPI0020CD528E|nr:serine hydrolase domain-containing protein [Arthrobacter sp. DNA4]UTT71284.1 beta-lactamase family protein [Arthrobacter sp. DNA4]